MQISRRTAIVWGLKAIVASSLATLSALLSSCSSVTDPQEGYIQIRPNKTDLLGLIQAGSVADFLQKRVINIEYEQQSDWNFGSGLLLMSRLVTRQGDHGLGGYEYFINGQCVQGAINLVGFAGGQKLVIRRNGQFVWGYKPSIRSDMHMHQEALLEPN